MKQKQHKSTDLSSSNVPDNHQRNASYLNSGWGISIENKLMFTQTELNRDIIRPGKNIGNKDHHSVPTTLHKAKTFIEDENLHEIQGTGDQQCFYFKPIVVTASEKMILSTSLNWPCVLSQRCTALKLYLCGQKSGILQSCFCFDVKVCKFALFLSL